MAKSKAAMARAEEAAKLQREGRAGKTAAEARRTATVTVESPYGHAGGETVTVASDTVAWLAARGMIDDRQRAAAERYRQAHETVHAGMACILGRDGNGGARADGLSERRLDAARDLNQAALALGPLSKVVRGVVAEGRSISDVAMELHGGAGKLERGAVSHMLRLALKALADVWDRPVAPRWAAGWQDDAAGPATDEGVAPGLSEILRVARSTLRRVYLA
ncbi:hypothetical protein ATO13_08576 [Stappia sp. 22II-S9-Z10]|nr:hypothetical protein ATO13_08576 [Stappia sp. 22II-S9-Z10]